MDKDLKIIKKYYGEKMMHLCRELFPTLLEQEGYLSKLMLENFAPSRFLYDDIISNNMSYEFSNYINNLTKAYKLKIQVNKTPKELLGEADYNLYECKTEEDIQFFKRYYKAGEELCTFNGGRLDNCHVFFAVKKNVEEIIRENFSDPKRQDEYGTSVISIQFTKGETNTLSIKNRYNHTVNNPDATFSNNLENIINGLTDSFEKEYNLNINQNHSTEFELSGYVKADDGKYYKYNYEMNNMYYCPDNIIINNFKVNHLPKERFIVLDYFVLDLKEKTITTCLEGETFHNTLKKIEKVNIIKEDQIGNKKIEIIENDKIKAVIKINKLNQIIEYENNDLTKVKDDFLYFNNTILNIKLPKVEEIGDYFLPRAENIKEMHIENVKTIGSFFLGYNLSLENLSLPKVEKIGDDFLYYNLKLNSIVLPKLRQVGSCFLFNNKILYNIIAPKLETIAKNFLCCNESLENLSLPKLKTVRRCFLYENKKLNSLNLPKLKYIGSYFLFNNIGLKTLFLPSAEEIGDSFLCNNVILNKTDFPKLRSVGSFFLKENKKLKKLELLELVSVLDNFLSENEIIEEICLPNLQRIGPYFLYNNKKLKSLKLNEVIWIDHNFLSRNEIIKYIYAPNLIEVFFDFLTSCKPIKLYAPNFHYKSEKIVLVSNEEDLYNSKITSTEIVKKNIKKDEKLGKQKVK